MTCDSERVNVTILQQCACHTGWVGHHSEGLVVDEQNVEGDARNFVNAEQRHGNPDNRQPIIEGELREQIPYLWPYLPRS